MKKAWWLVYLRWIKVAFQFYLKARTRYDVHSPFLSKWIKDVLEDDREYYIFGRMRTALRYWEQSKETVTYQNDPGAGSRAGQGAIRSTQELVKKSVIDERAGKLLFRTARDLKPKTILELGTNMGFSAAWLKAAAPHAKMITIEGNPTFEPLAAKTWKIAQTSNIIQQVGLFDTALPEVLTDLKKVDLVWIDGDHRFQATIDYVKACMPFLTTDAVIIIGDIYWSDGMMEAWESLHKMEEVRLSVDVFGMGYLFFSPNFREKQHFSLVPWWMKPWRFGFF